MEILGGIGTNEPVQRDDISEGLEVKIVNPFSENLVGMRVVIYCS